MKHKTHLLIIDPQNSFCNIVPPDEQQIRHDGELCVPGAWEDMVRVADMIDRIGDKIDEITITLDSHHRLHISHPMWFKDRNGKRPAPFTGVREEKGIFIGTQFGPDGPHDVGELMTSRPVFHQWTIEYDRSLAVNSRYNHMIWPEHCLIGTPGHNVVKPLMDALFRWEEKIGIVNIVTKGSTLWTEHYSAVQAEVIHPKHPETQPNARFVADLEEADELLLAGEASSHCVANTMRDIISQAQDDSLPKKVKLLTDAMSPVPSFEALETQFLDDMNNLGVQTTTTVEYLAIPATV